MIDVSNLKYGRYWRRKVQVSKSQMRLDDAMMESQVLLVTANSSLELKQFSCCEVFELMACSFLPGGSESVCKGWEGSTQPI